MNICFIGGDLRSIELIKLFNKKENSIYLIGLEKSEQLSDFEHNENLKETIEMSDVVITSIPLSKNGKSINSVFSNNEILIEDIFNIAKNKKIITGNITKEIESKIKVENNNEIIDILKYEDLTVLNAIPTSEGAIQIAMELSKITIHNSNCLILGFGRIGKILAKMLSGIGANVYCEARKEHDIAWIQSYGYNSIHLKDLNENLNKFDFIFNTIPYLILDKNNLKLVKKDCILIDLASKPGGIDFEEANRLELKNQWALALPGKVAPKTSADYLYRTIKNLL